LQGIEKVAKKSRIKHVVILIPTKEFVYQENILSLIDDDGSYSELIQYEADVWEKMKVRLDDSNIKYFDVLPALRKAVKDDLQIYTYSTNGHPNIIGYNVIAESIYDMMVKDGLIN